MIFSYTKQMILDNPDLPLIIVKSGDYTDFYDFSNIFCEDVRFEVGEYLNSDNPCDELRGYSDRDEFKEDLSNYLADYYEDYTDEQFDEVLKAELAKYEPYWTKCIIIHC